MSDDVRQQIEQLKTTLVRDEERAASLEEQAEAIHRRLHELKQRYSLIVKPLADKLEAVKAAIAELENKRLRSQGTWSPPADYVSVEEQYRQSWVTGEKTTRLKEDTQPEWTPPADYVSVEEQYRRKWGRPLAGADENKNDYMPPSGEFIPPATSVETPEGDLKKLYRLLARRHHPDYATDDIDRHKRTTLMAQINDAYERGDLGTLQSLAGYDDLVPEDDTASDASMLELQLRGLQLRYNQVRRRIFDLKQQIHDLEQSDLMQLKNEEDRLKRFDRNLLQELAADIDREYREHMRRLYELQTES